MQEEYREMEHCEKIALDEIDKLLNDSDIKHTVSFIDDTIKVDISSCSGVQCPLSLVLYLDKTGYYAVYWVVQLSGISGPKTDLCYLWSGSMGIILKIFLNSRVNISYIEHPVVEGEIVSALISFEEKERYYNKYMIKDIVREEVAMFLAALEINSYIFGTFGNRKVENSNNLFSSLFSEDDKISRENHVFYSDSKNNVSMIQIDSDEYKPELIIRFIETSFAVSNDIFLRSENQNGYIACNFFGEKEYNIVKKILDKVSVKDYRVIAQDNVAYLLEDKRIWVITGFFCHMFLEKKCDMEARRKLEGFILGSDLHLSWKCPVSAGRFESLIADLIEKEANVTQVRLLGKTNNADGGRDLLIYKKVYDTSACCMKEYLQIGQCKAYNKSVNKSHVLDIRDTMEHYNAKGFFLAASSNVTTNLIDHLCELKKKYDVDWWTEREIFHKLKSYPALLDEYSDIIAVDIDQKCNLN